MTVTSAQHVGWNGVLAREMDRGEDHSDQPIRVLAIVRRVAAMLCVPLVRSRRRQLLKTTKPWPDAKGRGVPSSSLSCGTQAG